MSDIPMSHVLLYSIILLVIVAVAAYSIYDATF